MRLARLSAVLLAAALAAGCGAGSPSGSSASTQVKRDWEAFWSARTTTAQKVALLQDGAQFAAVIALAEKSPLAAQLSSTVTKVTLHGTTATVTWTAKLGSQSIDPGIGRAVLVHGRWLVSDQTFCALAQFEVGRAPAGCP